MYEINFLNDGMRPKNKALEEITKSKKLCSVKKAIFIFFFCCLHLSHFLLAVISTFLKFKRGCSRGLETGCSPVLLYLPSAFCQQIKGDEVWGD